MALTCLQRLIMYLNCKTNFSFCYGTFTTKQLVEEAVEKGVTALALTNINATADLWEFVKLCNEAGIKPIPGVEIRNGKDCLYILIAANENGLTAIHTFLSAFLLDKKEFPAATEAVNCFQHAADGFIIYPFGSKSFGQLKINERFGITYRELHQLYGIDKKIWTGKLVVRQPVTVQNKQCHSLHRLLRCIDLNMVLSKLPADQQCAEDEIFLSPAALLHHFRDHSSIIANTYKLIDQCEPAWITKSDKNKQTYGDTKEDDRILLEKLAMDGLVMRYGKKNKIASARIKKELLIIHQQGFNAYFLINHDIIRYAQSRRFYYVGRGSGANSIVAYCLRITDVDPIALNLYFERFLNPHRTSPPDFDIDFSWTDRDEVIDYIFKRYGKNKVCLLGSYPTFKHDSIIRELGKVFGITDEEIKLLQRTNAPTDKIGRMILQYGKLMKGFPSHPSLHPCGMLITEQPVLNYAALFMPPKGFPTAMIDMFTAEDTGINKFDILSQRGLGHIKEALKLIRQNKNIEIDIHDVQTFMQDKMVATQIREANTIGCFYIESPAMRQLLKKLRCDDYITLVAASSIIRPGVAQSGMMREYIHRFHHRQDIKYLHPLFEEHLSETFGVMVFQEDVIKIAHYYAGLDLGKADILRRAMSGKYRNSNQFEMVRDEFYAGALLQGHPVALNEEIWRQMESFAGYSFNKAHSASFAVESYMSLYLKTYYPKEFMVAVINNFGGFYSRELYFLELLKCGGKIMAPCINHSDEYTNIDNDNVYCGFIHIKGLQGKLVELILEDRKIRGSYAHLQDFIERTGVGIEQLDTLVSIGAFRFTGKTKKQLLWEANFLQKKNQPALHNNAPALFLDKPVAFDLPELLDNPLHDLYDEMEILGFTLGNPFAMVDDDPSGYVAAKDLALHCGKRISVLAYFIARKQASTKNNQEMFFGTFVDSALDWIDTVHFPDAAKRYPMNDSGFYKITGKVTEDFGVYTIEAHQLLRVGYKKRSYDNL